MKTRRFFGWNGSSWKMVEAPYFASMPVVSKLLFEGAPCWIYDVKALGFAGRGRPEELFARGALHLRKRSNVKGPSKNIDIETASRGLVPDDGELAPVPLARGVLVRKPGGPPRSAERKAGAPKKGVMSLPQEMLSVLALGPKTFAELADVFKNHRKQTVRWQVWSLKRKGLIEGDGKPGYPGKWRLKAMKAESLLEHAAAGTKILIKNQTRPKENGIYVVGAQTITSRLERLEKALANHDYARIAARLSAIEALLGVPGK